MSESALEEFDVSEVSYEIGLYDNNSFIKNFVAVAAYIRLASRSQAKISKQRNLRLLPASVRSHTCAICGFRPLVTSILASPVDSCQSMN